MKNYIKKLITLFAFSFLFFGQGVFATSIWNNGSQGPECPDINIASGSNGWGSPCWTGTNINVQPGSVVSVKIYYHNASTPAVTATNTRIKLISSNGSSTNHSFSGQIISPQGNLYTNSVTANVSPAQTLTYNSTTWYVQNANGVLVQTPLLNGQSGSEVIGSNGLYIGNVVSGWTNGQGAIVVNFTVSNSLPQSDCSISNFIVNPNSVNSGSNTTLSWNTNNCTSGYINQGVGSVSFPTGNKTVYNLNNTTTYTLTAYGNNGSSDTESVTVNVNNLSTTGNLTASYSSCIIPDGQSTCNIPFSWNTINPVQGAISEVTHNWNTVASGNSGNQSFNISNGSQTYYLYHNSQLLDQETVNANCASGSSWNGYLCLMQSIGNNCSISYFNANPSSIDEGDSSTLTWNTNGDCTSASINNGVGTVSTSYGSRTVYPNNTTTYTLTVYGNNGYSNTRSTTVYVDENQNNNSSECRISYFRASPDSIDEGDSSKLTWDTNGDCDSASINRGIGSVDEDGGSEYVYPSSTTTYKLTVYGEDGDSDSETVTVDVDENQNNNDDCRISYFTANPTTINSGGLATLSWNTNDCVSVSISNIGSVNESGNQTVYPKSTTSYTIYAYGDSGSPASKTVRVNVNNYNYIIPSTPVYNTCAVTTVATNISSNSATLNGLVTNSNGNANTYFEYGKTVDLGMQTSPRSISGNTTFTDVISGLSPNTIYFYRLVSNCNNGIGKGAIEVLQTTGAQTITRTIIRQGTTVIGTESPIMLKIENRYESIKEGDIVDYIITYKNIGNKTLLNPVLQVVLPKGMTYLKSSRGTYVEDTRTLTVPLKDLVSGEEGVVYLQSIMDSIDSGNAQIVTTAILVYTSQKGAQENAIAYVLNNPVVSSSSFGLGLGALALFGNIFGMGIIGWLILLILILLAILLFRKVYHRN